MKNLRNGFTLIETLISILIIVTVLTAVSLSASAIKSTARANKVISDMYMWKTAALAWYAEHKDEVKADGSVGYVASDADMYYGTKSENKLFRDEVAKYLNNAKNISGAGNANVFKMKCDKQNGRRGRWFVCYNFPDDPTIKRDLRKKLALRAQEAGLLKTRTNNTIYDGTQDYLYLLVIDFNIAK